MITQLQLDLAQDEIYVLKHGTPPPYKHADKQTKRASLKPEVETVKPDLDMEPIDLTGLSVIEDEPFLDVVEDAPMPEEDVALDDDMATDASEDVADVVEAESEAPAEEVAEEAPVEPEPEVIDEEVEDEPKSTVKLRKAAPVSDNADA
jgi:hypothetical protein